MIQAPDAPLGRDDQHLMLSTLRKPWSIERLCFFVLEPNGGLRLQSVIQDHDSSGAADNQALARGPLVHIVSVWRPGIERERDLVIVRCRSILDAKREEAGTHIPGGVVSAEPQLAFSNGQIRSVRLELHFASCSVGRNDEHLIVPALGPRQTTVGRSSLPHRTREAGCPLACFRGGEQAGPTASVAVRPGNNTFAGFKSIYRAKICSVLVGRPLVRNSRNFNINPRFQAFVEA